MVLEIISNSQWQEIKSSKKITAAVFWAPWCSFCISLKPIFESISKEFQEIQFLRVNVDEQSDIATKHGVQGIPLIKFFCEDKEIGEIIGYIPKNILKEKIMEIVKNAPSCVANTSRRK